MGVDRKQLSVAVLIREPSQWPEAQRTCKVLLETGAAVSLFCLGHAPMTMENSTPDEMCIECFSDRCQPGMIGLSLNEIAEKLKRCDLVIPI